MTRYFILGYDQIIVICTLHCTDAPMLRAFRCYTYHHVLLHLIG